MPPRKPKRKPKPRSTLSSFFHEPSEEGPNLKQEPSDYVLPSFKEEPEDDTVPNPNEIPKDDAVPNAKQKRKEIAVVKVKRKPKDKHSVPYIKQESSDDERTRRPHRKREPSPPVEITDTPEEQAAYKAMWEAELATFKPYIDEVNFLRLHYDPKIIESRLLYAAKDAVGEDGKPAWRRVPVGTRDPMGEECQEQFNKEMMEPEEIDPDLPAFIETLHGPGKKWSREEDWFAHPLSLVYSA